MKVPLQAVYTWYRNTLRHPKYRWWLVLGTLAYLLNPVDISPDFLPILGEVDDIALVTLLVAEVSQIAVEKMKQRQASRTSPSASTAPTVEVDAVSVQD